MQIKPINKFQLKNKIIRTTEGRSDYVVSANNHVMVWEPKQMKIDSYFVDLKYEVD